MDKTAKEKNYLIKHDFTNQILEADKLSARTTNNTITVSISTADCLKQKM